MAVSFPLSLADFYNHLPIEAEAMAPVAQNAVSGTEGGEILSAELAPSLWAGSVTLKNMRLECADFIAARLSALEVPGRAFFARYTRRDGTINDPDGSGLTTSPVLDDVNSSGRLKFKTMPANYKVQRGDLFSFTYGSNPTRYALHRAVSTASTGLEYIDVTPPVREGWADGDPVTFVQPVCKAVIVPGSINYGSGFQRWVSGMSFQWRQTLR